nr:HEAT repeat domain-containing protein [Nodosilinea sp. P-1105]
MLGARLAGEVSTQFQESTVKLITCSSEPAWLQCKLLARVRSDHAVENLSEIFLDSDWFIRLNAIKALGKIGTDKATLYLLRGFEDTDNDVIREAYLWLRKISPEFLVSNLIELANKLEGYSQEKIIDIILPLLEDHEIEKKYQSSINQSSVIKRHLDLLSIMSSVLANSSKSLIQEDDFRVSVDLEKEKRNIQSHDISELIDLVSNKRFRSILLDHPDWRAREYALKELGKELTSKFELAATSEDNEILELALSLLRSIFSLIDKLAKDNDWRVRESLVRFIGKIYSSMRNQKQIGQNFRKFESVLKIGDQVLLDLCHDICEDVRAKATYELARFPDRIGDSVFLDLLKDSDYSVRCFAAQALGETKSSEAVPSLIELLNDESPDVSSASAQSLGKISQDPALLVQYLSKLSDSLRMDRRGDIQKLMTVIQANCKFYNYEVAENVIPQGKTVSLYFSYAPADAPLQTQLAKHLTLLEHQGVITSWSSHQILPGEDRTQTIHQQLNTADIILLLISPDAIADDTCYHLEIQRAIERHQAGEARVIPILLRPVDWQGAPFSQLDVLPKNHEPVTTWPNPDKAFQEIAEGIRQVAMEMRREKDNSSKMDSP